MPADVTTITTTAAPLATVTVNTALMNGLTSLVLLSIFVERALSVVFEWKVWAQSLSNSNLKAPVSALVSIMVCYVTSFDMLVYLFGQLSPTLFGEVFTGMIVAGGSAGSIRLFQDVLGFSKTVRDASMDAKVSQAQAQQLQAQASQQNATVQLQAAQLKAKATSMMLTHADAAQNSGLPLSTDYVQNVKSLLEAVNQLQNNTPAQQPDCN